MIPQIRNISKVKNIQTVKRSVVSRDLGEEYKQV
jgi:hypothetical protein